MSNSGWGGPGDGPLGEAWQNEAPRGGAPQGSQPQPGSGQPTGGQPQPGIGWPASPYGAPSSAPWQSPPQSPVGPQGPHAPGGPGQPQGPGSPQGPGGPGSSHRHGGVGQQPPRKRPWALITVALGCVLAMVLVVGGGITYLVLSRTGDDTTIATATPSNPETSGETESPTPAEASTPFEVVVPYDPPTDTVDELWQVMSDNPLTEGTLPALSTCNLPATPV